LGDNAALYEIDIVMEWGNGMENSDKIPSVISYSSKSRERPEANWGSNLAEKAIAMKHMKLRLDSQSVSEELDFLLQLLDGTRNLDFENIKDARGMPDYTDKPPEEIVTDYLTKVFEHVLHKVDNFTREVRETIPTDIVITVPVGWSYAARNSTYRAVTKAGFNKRNFPRLQDVMFISEPEAAAIYTARYFDEQNEQFLNVSTS
jgi:molecular chaperone DnaK (HSP70)